MYPTVVMVLVERQRSMADICEISPSNASKFSSTVSSGDRAATLGHLSFAVGTKDNQLESQRSRALYTQEQEYGLVEKGIGVAV